MQNPKRKETWQRGGRGHEEGRGGERRVLGGEISKGKDDCFQNRDGRPKPPLTRDWALGPPIWQPP